MSFIFTMRSAQSNGVSRREPASIGALPRIAEDHSVPYPPPNIPPVPPRARNRPYRSFPFNIEDSPPPPYPVEIIESPKGEKLADIRREILNKRQIAKRGGWTRLCLIAIIAALCIIGLVVGLVVGLKNHDAGGHNDGAGGASGSAPGSSSTTRNVTFPAGSYSFETYLATVEADCTSNPATWMCYPYVTYAESPSQSNATFQWIITQVGDTTNYTISSSANPFAFTFTNISLVLNHAGQEDEHYYFETSITKKTIPRTPLSAQNVAATCSFDQTTFQAYLYTKMPRTFPASSPDIVVTGIPFAPWPNAVTVEQISGSGPGTPTCLSPSGQSLGDFSIQSGSKICHCRYLNTDT